MGDAAHVHSPAGGQGMNTGIIDAVVLGELLGDVVNGVRAEAELDLYETLRRPAAQEVLELAGKMTDMALTRNPVKRFVRNLLLSLMNLNQLLKRRMALKLSGLSRAPLARLPAPSRVPGSIAPSKPAAKPALKLAA